MIQLLIKARQWFFAQKYRFDLGLSFMSIINFAMLAFALSKGFNISNYVIAVFIMMVFVLVWLFGWFMDVIVKAAQHTEREGIQRSETWQQHLEQMDTISKKLDDILLSLMKEKK
jgi:hypothetical protein